MQDAVSKSSPCMRRLQAVNQLASLIGDERAGRARAAYGKTLKPILVTSAGVLPIREPFPRPA
jgi:hypothetical protein